MRNLPLFILFSINTCLFGQDLQNAELNPRVDKPAGINAALGGPGLYSLSVDYFVAPTLNIEAGIGPGIFGGIRYHMGGNKASKNWTPFIGIYATYLWVFENFASAFGGDVSVLAYVPLGIQYNGKKGFAFGIEVSLFINGEAVAPWAGLKVGQHF